MKKRHMAGWMTGVFLVGAANAAFIPIYDTGVDDSNLLLSSGVADTHYTLVNPTSASVTAFSTGNGHTAWVNPVSNGRDAQWIIPVGGVTSVSKGLWTYSTTFDLTGLNPATASIVGDWSSDNEGEIFLNGVSTGIVTPTDAFTSYQAFSLNSGFISGVNTLTFEVLNAGAFDGPSGLLVDITSATADLIPEPATLGLVGILGGVLIFIRSRVMM